MTDTQVEELRGKLQPQELNKAELADNISQRHDELVRLDPEVHSRLLDSSSTRSMREMYAIAFFFVTAIQLVVLNATGWTYLFLNPDVASFRIMISGSMLEVFAIVAIITRSLFPAITSKNRKR